jgi:hypothetical protein
MRTLVLNSSNIVANTGNAQFLYKFPATAMFRSNLIGVASISQFFQHLILMRKILITIHIHMFGLMVIHTQ